LVHKLKRTSLGVIHKGHLRKRPAGTKRWWSISVVHYFSMNLCRLWKTGRCPLFVIRICYDCWQDILLSAVYYRSRCVILTTLIQIWVLYFWWKDKYVAPLCKCMISPCKNWQNLSLASFPKCIEHSAKW